LSKLNREKFVRLTAGIVICTFIFASTAARPAASLQPRYPSPFDASHIEAAGFIEDSLHATRQAATKSTQQVSAIFGMETEPAVGEVAAKWRVVEAEIDEEQQVLARCRREEACPVVAQSLRDISPVSA
jgi:hypothetical protein